MAIALQERIAYYPPLCGGSNGEREGILSVMVMMHFKWVVPIIYQWMDNGTREHPLGYSHDAKEMVKRSVQSIQRAPAWFYGDRLNEGSAGVFLSIIIMVGQPVCSESVNIQGREDNERRVCMCVGGRVRVRTTNKSHAVEREP